MRAGDATRALATGAMVAGMVPATEDNPSHWTPKATTRIGLIDEIQRFILRWGRRAPERWVMKLASLRRQRGRLARRMKRRRKSLGFLGKRRSQPSRPLHADQRITRRLRVAILRAEKRPVSGRQWRHLRKAMAHRERAS